MNTSIIIRTKNENRWLDWLLDIISDQKKINYEIIIVNNGNRRDLKTTLNNFKNLDINVVHIKKYLPGYALNKGIEKSKYNLITMISSHCIPTNENWLYNLNFPVYKNKNCFACYGRQEPLSFTPSQDKRDLAITFGIESKKQFKDPFFHNANSVINKRYWNKIKFDSTISNIEDRIWAATIQKKFKKYIFYQPKASVYHWHGIHHTNDIERLESTVNILNKINLSSNNVKKNIKPIFFIPFSSRLDSINLLEETLSSILDFDINANIFISTTYNYKEIISKLINEKFKSIKLFIRKRIYNNSKEPLDFVYRDLSRFVLKKSYSLHTPVICLEVIHGKRPKDFFNKLLINYKKNNYSSLFSSLKISSSFIIEDPLISSTNNLIKKINDNLTPKDLNVKKNYNYIIIKSYGFVSSLDLLNIHDMCGLRPGIININRFKKYNF